MSEDKKKQRIKKQKTMILRLLQEKGNRITRQRGIIIDTILEENCTCCKEICGRVAKKDPNIGAATVYRMINKLEEIGAISRRDVYMINCDTKSDCKDSCSIEFDDDTSISLSEKTWYDVIQEGLKACGYNCNGSVRKVHFV